RKVGIADAAEQRRLLWGDEVTGWQAPRASAWTRSARRAHSGKLLLGWLGRLDDRRLRRIGLCRCGRAGRVPGGRASSLGGAHRLHRRHRAWAIEAIEPRADGHRPPPTTPERI